ncbi:transcriptional regulator [Leptospira wolffii]|uniref:Transcriptional regulator n=1 Tax=Leptospira wolffii TaxID=409998 RepID=A0A2M9Z7V4_9LEPT|nr:helix-turn-helix domain-containing protein [Leptospira wolffii]PJZ64447.1 transcriptional regulator [Leptospira wolffii]TGK54849.1 transcriptional regulator [Leptospira wolffii]TGK65381.1 transcriptional regulator [Leptospira wolffii]TGK70771.1 transcriptional regulator [Leptospira wolffii]TGL26419.1 transcriptional regulator [Leptospira wolffii]
MKPQVITGNKQLGQIVRDRRKLLRISQTALGEAVGLNQATISSLEIGKARVRIDTIFRVLSELGLELTIGPKPSPDDANRNSPW